MVKWEEQVIEQMGHWAAWGLQSLALLSLPGYYGTTICLTEGWMPWPNQSSSSQGYPNQTLVLVCFSNLVSQTRRNIVNVNPGHSNQYDMLHLVWLLKTEGYQLDGWVYNIQQPKGCGFETHHRQLQNFNQLASVLLLLSYLANRHPNLNPFS